MCDCCNNHNIVYILFYIYIGGNHEFYDGEAWQSYFARYPTPHQISGSSNPCYYGKEVGVVHLISLCSYAGYFENSTQYLWLADYLATRINRQRTPWLMVTTHAPLYNSNNKHWGTGEPFRLSIEPLLYKYGVDIVLAGHVHAYERTVPVYNNKPDPCGATYLNLGDGGNYEGVHNGWRDISDSSTHRGSPWSAFREASFGVASLVVLNANQANYSWHRHACLSSSQSALYANFSDNCVTPGDTSAQNMLTSDSVIIVRPSKSICPNRWTSTEVGSDTNNIYAQSTTSSSTGNSSNQNGAVIGLSVMVALLSVACIVLGVLLFIARKRKANDESPLHQKNENSNF